MIAALLVGIALAALAFALAARRRAVMARRRAARATHLGGTRAMMEAWRTTRGPVRLPDPAPRLPSRANAR